MERAAGQNRRSQGLYRARVAAAAALVLILATIAWLVLLRYGLVESVFSPGEAPFRLSDRISTILVVEGDDGVARARFQGWRQGDDEITADEFYRILALRQRDLPWFFLLFDVTSWAGVFWVAFGFAGQAVFMARMVVQWRASERVRSSVVPPAFWWLSLVGSSMLMVYFVWRWEIIGFLGQGTGWFIYLRNLWFIYGQEET
jgi:lipid-A-disaccharide synthase-like uncharacterized protein